MNSTWPEQIEIRPRGPIVASVRPPGSKSLTNRAVVCAALAEGRSVLSGALDSEDTRVMAAALQQLGLQVDVEPDRCQVAVCGCGGQLPAAAAELPVASMGSTTMASREGMSLGILK